MATTTIERALTSTSSTSFSRRSATYTASTFAAFEYGSSFHYHGMYNVSGSQSTSQTNKFSSEVAPPVRVTLDDLDDLINALSPDELKELSAVDPDDPSVPPNMRCVYHCDKKATGEIDRHKMLKDLREMALQTPDKEDRVIYVPGQIRGKKFETKEDELESSIQESEEEVQNPFEPSTPEDSEFAQLLEVASLTDLMEIADILGVTYQNDCQATELKVYEVVEENHADIDDIISRVEANDKHLDEVNLNNIKDIDNDKWQRLFNALADTNNVVQRLSAANCDITDTVAAMIVQCISKNATMKRLTLDSNCISGEMVVKLIRAASHTKSIQELRCTNQLNCKYLGNRIEVDIANALQDTPQLVKLGVTMEFRDTLNKTAVQLQKNLERRRRMVNEMSSSTASKIPRQLSSSENRI